MTKIIMLKALIAVLNPRSDATEALVTRGMLSMTAILGMVKVSLTTVKEWLQVTSLGIGCLVGLATLLSLALSIRRTHFKRGLPKPWPMGRPPSSSSSSHHLLGISVLLLLCVQFLAGCGLLPSEHQKSESVRATEALSSEQGMTVRRIFEMSPALTNSGRVHEQVEITTSSATDAGSKSNLSGSSSVTIPLGVKLGLAGLGLLVLVVAVRYAWTHLKGTAVGQGIALADDWLARRIRDARSKAQTTTDQGELLKLNAEIAELEAERGRNAARR